MSNKQLLLPLFFVRKQTKFGLNERNLIVLLLVSTVFTLILIIKNLPSNVSISGEELNAILVPKLINQSKDHQFIHNEQDHKHNFKPVKKQEQIENILPEKKIDLKTLERKEKIKKCN